MYYIKDDDAIKLCSQVEHGAVYRFSINSGEGFGLLEDWNEFLIFALPLKNLKTSLKLFPHSLSFSPLSSSCLC